MEKGMIQRPIATFNKKKLLENENIIKCTQAIKGNTTTYNKLANKKRGGSSTVGSLGSGSYELI